MTDKLALVDPPRLIQKVVRIRGTVPLETVEAALGYLEASGPARSQRAYDDVWDAFLRWAKKQKRPPIPADEGFVIGYLTHMAQSGSPISSVRRARTVIRQAHLCRKLGDPTAGELVVKLLTGIESTHGKKPKRQAAPFLLRDLTASRGLFGDDTRGVRDWAMLSTAWWGALRRIELVRLDHEDVMLVPGGIVLQLRGTKTAASEVMDYPVQASERLCPVVALTNWIGLLGTNTGALFCTVMNGGHIRKEQRASAESVNRLVKRTVKKLRLDPKSYSAHSLRAGLASELRKRGVPAEIAMRQTRHKNREVFSGYVRRGGFWGDHPMYGLIGEK